MDILNAWSTQIADWLFSPFRNYPATGLVFWSTVTGIMMTYVFGKTSNQTGLRRAADNIRAQLLGVKLFKDDLAVTFHCQMKLLRSTGKRLLHSVPPMLVMIIPLTIVLIQIALRYDYRPLIDSEQAVVTMHIRPDAWKQNQEITLLSADGFEVETESLRDEKNSTILWRIRASGDQPTRLRWQIGDQMIEKTLSIASHEGIVQPTNPKRPGTSFSDQLFYPGEPSLAATSSIESIDVQYQHRDTPVLGINVPWWATFFGVSMIVAFVAGKFMGVQY